MFRRVKHKQSMIPKEGYIAYGGPKRDPYKMNSISPSRLASWVRFEEEAVSG